MVGQNVLATGFVVDDEQDGTIFPSAGGKSSDASVQLVYWKCLTVLFATARMANPDLRLVLFSNARPPTIHGTNFEEILDGYRVECKLVPISTRIANSRVKSWGNVLYFFDIFDYMESAGEEVRLILIDSDVVINKPLDDLFAKLNDADYIAYPVDTEIDEDVNGLSRLQMTDVSKAIGAQASEAITHFGGEIFGTSTQRWSQDRETFKLLVDGALSGEGPAAGVRTEEHIYSIALSALPVKIYDCSSHLKRIWTTPRLNTAAKGDENLAMWHLPAEKRFGFDDFFKLLEARKFSLSVKQEALQDILSDTFGVPDRSSAKRFKDISRRVSAKLKSIARR